ncbi:hypothetical protein FH878_18675 [Salmonella enterica]|nr:hypothetical protein [Salmonella enterica]
MTIYITELITGLLVIAGLFLWWRKMMRKKQAEKLFCDAMDALAKVGESPLNYCLSYARGFMAAENKKEYLHEWED